MIKLSDKELLEELQKRFEDNYNALNELKNLTEELWRVNKKLEDSENLKSHFLSNIRNEIINPFASILALSKNIMSINDQSIDKARRMAGLIHSEAFILDFQLNNIFSAAEIEAGISYPQITKVQVIEILKNVIESFVPLADQKKVEIVVTNKIKISPGEDFYFKTDAPKLQLIISNLISNAVIYSNDSSVIDIVLGTEGDNLIISVKDKGVGIDTDHQNEIFDRFKRLTTKICTPKSGQGLGLSVVKEMISLLSGTISLKSEKGIGSEFTVQIPEASIESDSFSLSGNEEIF